MLPNILAVIILTVTNLTGLDVVTAYAEAAYSELGLEAEVIITATPARVKARNYVTRVQGKYFIYLDTGQRESKIITVITHEMIHIQQYETGRLIQISEYLVSFDAEKYYLLEVPHEQRPWEIEANRLGRRLERTIRKQLRKTN